MSDDLVAGAGVDLEWADGGPRSRRFGDVYFSNVDGLAESRAVFLQGCGLPQAWAGRPRFAVAELGFGTGLNIAALLELWRRERPANSRLSIFSVEAHLLSRDEAARALGVWRGELGEAVDALLARWPAPRRGFQRLDLLGFNATLDLYVGEVGEALAHWSGPADAWFLDGFAPSRNPAMWSDDVLAAVARLSAPGARLASFTVAGHVRRGLAAAGVEVEKRPGFGAKRERLEGRLPGALSELKAPSHALVIGAGIAGASLARAFARHGVRCTVLDTADPGAGASGNPAALVTPRFDAGFGPPAELHAQAFARAVDLYRRETPRAVVAVGALQLGPAAREGDRYARLATWDGFAPGALQPLTPDDAARRLDDPMDPGQAALLIADALTVSPQPILQAWLAGADLVRGEVARLERREGLWTALDRDGTVLAQAEIVCLAAGALAEALASSMGLGPGFSLGLRPVRGQAEFTCEPIPGVHAAAWGAYAIPMAGGGLLFGASHVRGDNGLEPRPAEREANLAALATRRPGLAVQVRALPPGALQSRAAVRAATPDHLPLAGAWSGADKDKDKDKDGGGGVYVLGGFGGRGFTLAPLLAEHVAALATAAPSPLPVDLAARLRPFRFAQNRRPR